MALFAHDFITCLLIGGENLLLFNCFYYSLCVCGVDCASLCLYLGHTHIRTNPFRIHELYGCANRSRNTLIVTANSAPHVLCLPGVLFHKVLVVHFAPLKREIRVIIDNTSSRNTKTVYNQFLFVF